jgi:hypothetical protein
MSPGWVLRARVIGAITIRCGTSSPATLVGVKRREGVGMTVGLQSG